jgi:3-oxoacyl-(acyl-carrier-protein) synthase
LPVFEVKKFKQSDPIGLSRSLELLLKAVDEALTSSDLLNDIRSLRIGVCFGTTVACQINDLGFYTAYRSCGGAPMAAVNTFLKGNLARAVSDRLGLSGPCNVIVNACSSGTDAIGLGMSWLRADICDVVVAGGADEMNLVPFCGFNSLGVASSELCAPFDRDRKGLNLGEGAGVLVLEKEEIARRRGNKSRLFVCGYGAGADAYHLTAPRPDGAGLESAINAALKFAVLNVSDIGFINAHGTSTRDNDKTEGLVLKRMFGPDVKFISTKGFTGHTLGAAGGLEAVFTALGLREGWIPASPGFVNQDPEIGISPLSLLTKFNAKYAMSTSLAFGGNNAAVILGIE